MEDKQWSSEEGETLYAIFHISIQLKFIFSPNVLDALLQEAGQTQQQWRPEDEAGRREAGGRRLCGGGSGSGGEAQQWVIIQEERQWPGQEGQSEGHQGE